MDIMFRSDIGVKLVQHVGGDASVVAAAKVSVEGAESVRHLEADVCRASDLPRPSVVRRLRAYPSPLVPRYFATIDRPRTHRRSLTVWGLTRAGRELCERG